MDAPPDIPDDDALRREILLGAARRPAAGEGASPEEPHRTFLIFSVGGALHAADLLHVRRIFRSAPVAPVPGAPPEVLGLMNCHGEVLCVLDPSKVLGLPPSPPADPEGGYVVVLHFGDREAGFRVDSADDVWEAPASAVGPVLESLEPAKAKFYEGTLERGGRVAGVLSPSACLNP